MSNCEESKGNYKAKGIQKFTEKYRMLLKNK